MRKLAAVAFALMSAGAYAAPGINFVNIPPSTNNTLLTATESIGGITIDGFTFSGGTFTAAPLWLRKQTNDNGLGVCSEGASNCRSGGGDVNELSNQANDEVIRLTKSSTQTWSDVWLSSLDQGGSNNNESGIIYWSNVATPDLNSITTFIKFSDNTALPGAAVEGSVFSYLVANGFNATAQQANYLFFRADAANGTNNDYLVYGVNTQPIPEPGTYALMAAGLLGVGFMARRRKA